MRLSLIVQQGEQVEDVLLDNGQETDKVEILPESTIYVHWKNLDKEEEWMEN